MSLFAIKSATNAADYYEKDGGYYVKDRLQDGTVRDSEWLGQLSNRLSGERVAVSDFRRALDGHLPGVVGQPLAGRSDRRVGWDFCNSAPKSVSMAALFDDRVVAAFNIANRESMAVLEKLVASRRTTNGKTVVENTGRALIASFEHWNAREASDRTDDRSTAADVSLHRHNVVLNITTRHDGKLVAIHNDRMVKVGQAKARTQFYGALGRELKKLGYELRYETDRTGRKWPEIASVSRDQVLMFSRRHQSISEVKARLARDPGVELQTDEYGRQLDMKAYYALRSDKQHIDLAEMKGAWRSQILAAGIKFEKESTVDKQINAATRQLAAEANLGASLGAQSDAIRDRIALALNDLEHGNENWSQFETGAPATSRMFRACQKVAGARGEAMPEQVADFGVAREYLARFGSKLNHVGGPAMSAGEDRVELVDAAVTEAHRSESDPANHSHEVDQANSPDGPIGKTALADWSHEAGWWDPSPPYRSNNDVDQRPDRTSGDPIEVATSRGDEVRGDQSKAVGSQPRHASSLQPRANRDADLASATADLRESMTRVGVYDFVHFRETRDASALLSADIEGLERRGRGEGGEQVSGNDKKAAKLTVKDRLNLLDRAAEMRRFARDHSSRLVSVQGRVYGHGAPQSIGGAFTVAKLRPADGSASPGFVVARDGIPIGLARQVDVGRAIRTRGDLAPVSDVKLKKNQISFTDATGERKTFEVGERAGWRGNKAMVIRDRETGRYVGSLVLDLNRGRAHFTTARLVKDPAESRRENALKLAKSHDRAYYHRGMSMYKREKFLFFKWTRKVGAGERAVVYAARATGLALKGSAILVRYAAKTLVNTLAVSAANKWQLGDERGAFRLRSDELRTNILSSRGYSQSDIKLSLKQDDLARKAMAEVALELRSS